MAQWIAGITRGHNGATCLLKDGEVVFYLEEAVAVSVSVSVAVAVAIS